MHGLIPCTSCLERKSVVLWVIILTISSLSGINTVGYVISTLTKTQKVS